MTNPGHDDVLIAEPAETYHAQAGKYLSSHLLAAFRRCPLLYQKHVLRLVDDADRPAFLVGRAAHVRILEGRDEYQRQFAVGGPINPKTGKPYGANTNAYAEWAAAQGKPVLTEDQAQLVESMAVGVAMNDHAVDLISDGQAEGVTRATYEGVPCQIRLDWFTRSQGIVDLKTADDLTYFEADARRYGYAYQLAFYRAVLALVMDGELSPVHLIAVEKKEPFRCGVWRISDDTLDQCARENAAAIRRLRDCNRLGHWPTGYEEIRVFDAI